MAIYDLFDSVNDVSTLGRHGNDALTQVFGINGVLDALNDVRESLSTQYMRLDGSKGVKLSRNGLGEITKKIPAGIRKGFVKIIDNPVVRGITFVTIAHQFGYSINEIAKGNHHPLNYYWTASSGIKLASMSARVSSAVKGVSITSKGLRVSSVVGKALSRLSMATIIIDMLVMIVTKLSEKGGESSFQEKDDGIRKVGEKDTYLRGTKQTMFIVNKSSGDGASINSGNLGLKKNLDVILFEDTDIRLLRINEHQAYYNLELLADDEKSTVASTRIDGFKKLVIKTEKAGVTKVVEVQDKSLFDLVGDMKYQELNYLGGDIDSKIVEDSKKRSKAKIFVNITDSKGLTVYEAAKDIISSDSLGIPISLVQAKRIVNDVVYEAIIGGIYTSKVVADFSCENIDCKKVITIEVSSHGSSDYVVKFPKACGRNRSVDFTLEVVTVPYAGTSDRVIDLSDDDINPEDVECEADYGHYGRVMLNIRVNHGSFKIALDNYLWDPKYQRVTFQFNKGDGFYKVSSTSLKLEPILYNYEERMRVDYDSFKYYKPDDRGLQIYHNQPNDENKIGFVDLKDKSIFDFNMEIIDGDLILLHNNATFIEMKNWSTCQPARKVIFTFNDTILKCIVSDCELEDKFNKEKIALLLEKEIFDAIDQDNMDEAEDLAGRIKSTDVEKLTSFSRKCASIKCQGHGHLHLAAKEGKWNVVKFLVDKGVDIMATDEHGKISFCYAVENGYVEMVGFMWEKAGSLGVQYEMLKALGYETFESAIKNGYVGMLDSLWEKAGSLWVRHRMLEAWSDAAFRLAAEDGRVDILNSLWKKIRSLEVEDKILRVWSFNKFGVAAGNGRVGILDSLWKKQYH